MLVWILILFIISSFTMTHNLSADEKKILKEIISNPDIIICPADKGKAIVLEDQESYLFKMQQQLDKLKGD